MNLHDVMAADIEAVFFNEDDFAEPVIWTPTTGLAVITSGIFDEIWEAVDPDTGALISSTQPRVLLMTSYLPADHKTDEGARLEARSKTFRIVDVQPDGEGTVLCYLHQVFRSEA